MDEKQILRTWRFLALLVHLFTATGAVLALLALQAAVDGRHAAMFFWLAVALIVDGVDGSLARFINVRQALPRFSGEILDLVIDFATYVVVPTYALFASGMLPRGYEGVLAAAILIGSAFYFADTTMKTPEGGFRGFPATWNIAAFLIFAFDAPSWANAGAIVVLVAAMFAPIMMVHPIRVRRFRPLTLAMLALWSLAALAAIVTDLQPNLWIKAGLGVASVYFVGIGFVIRHLEPEV
ncbi:phosphatidylcholine synthase [Phreatobacter aquaticus]|uniref:Phosphatidylcholine synthase n=1 Tax=Phreatobacter aquaticus TaxID=2570229 RepID=A0A4D7QPH4_9HYPH|nr:phosphatidylcholine synthase [Phreatobacter aquaticus]QCK87486.1 phosphatidylcholine synthase [Phreatobacter aquaticus]